jgi:hypothetical protein
LAETLPTDSPYKEVSNRAIEFYSKWNFYQQQTPEGASLPRKAALAWQEYRQTRLEWSLHEGDYLLPLYLIFSITGLLLPIPRPFRGLAVAGFGGHLIFYGGLWFAPEPIFFP